MTCAVQRYIAEKASPSIALRYVEALASFCQQLTTFPYRGTRRDDIRPEFRSIGFRHRATIIFSVESSGIVVIAGIYYGGRDIEQDWDDASAQ